VSLWQKARELESNPWPKIVTVGLVSGDYVLTGQRNDNKLWTSPGGHMDEGEDILTAGRREVLEESGIDLSGTDLHLIRAERLVSHRTGKPFVVFGLIANVDKSLATGKNDPDKEISLWKWVKIHGDAPELKAEARHAKDDFILSHLGVKMSAETKDKQHPEDRGRTMKQVSEDTQSAGYDARNPNQPKAEVEEPSLPDPKAKTPEEMKEDPEGALNIDEETKPF
jgi:8-oxo-dGTP pyrophosphatase MutT (NUDIX family)